jgi:hypothetical protein
LTDDDEMSVADNEALAAHEASSPSSTRKGPHPVLSLLRRGWAVVGAAAARVDHGIEAGAAATLRGLGAAASWVDRSTRKRRCGGGPELDVDRRIRASEEFHLELGHLSPKALVRRRGGGKGDGAGHFDPDLLSGLRRKAYRWEGGPVFRFEPGMGGEAGLAEVEEDGGSDYLSDCRLLLRQLYYRLNYLVYVAEFCDARDLNGFLGPVVVLSGVAAFCSILSTSDVVQDKGPSFNLASSVLSLVVIYWTKFRHSPLIGQYDVKADAARCPNYPPPPSSPRRNLFNMPPCVLGTDGCPRCYRSEPINPRKEDYRK